MRLLDFFVTLCLGGGDGGDVCVNVEVTEEEYELLKCCCRENEDINNYKGLRDLCQRIEEAARDENESCMMDFDMEEEIDYSSVSYMISIPEEISLSVDEENEDSDGLGED